MADGLKALTLWPAWQHFEEDHKGSITPGKLADFAILADNPMTVAEDAIAKIRVMQTIKEDRGVHARPGRAACGTDRGAAR